MCAHLWREYAAATHEHVQLFKQRGIASGADLTRFEELESEIESAARRRSEAHDAIKAHLSENHPPEQARTLVFGGCLWTPITAHRQPKTITKKSDEPKAMIKFTDRAPPTRLN
jgi:hypothetical protein